MNTQTLSRKSREELNGSLLTLYRKLTIKPETLPEKDENKSSSSVHSNPEPDKLDQDLSEVSPGIEIGI
jgi:hypothetical protein